MALDTVGTALGTQAHLPHTLRFLESFCSGLSSGSSAHAAGGDPHSPPLRRLVCCSAPIVSSASCSSRTRCPLRAARLLRPDVSPEGSTKGCGPAGDGSVLFPRVRNARFSATPHPTAGGLPFRGEDQTQ